MRSLLGALVALTAVAGCDDDDGGAWTLRPNVVEIGRPASGAISTDVITDAERDGDRIVLLRPSASSASIFIYAYLSISDDLGRTWRELQVRQELFTQLGGDSNQFGIYLRDGEIYLTLSRDIGSVYPAWVTFHVDQTTGDATEIFLPPMRTGWSFERRPEGTLRYSDTTRFYGSSPHTLWEYDPVTGEATYENFPCTFMGCTTPLMRSVDGGDTWDGYTQASVDFPVCLTRWDVASVTADESCVNRPLWPSDDYDNTPEMMFRGTTPYMAWSTAVDGDEQAYATAIVPGDPPTVSETLLLGPGKIDSRFRVGSNQRPRFADFTLIENPAPDENGYLARLADDGPERVQLPITPCTNDVGCGHVLEAEFPNTFDLGDVQWLLPLEDGEYLVFYTTVIDETGASAMYMARETPTFGPITGGKPPPGREVELPEGAQPMNELERACAMYTNCFWPYDTSVIFEQCLSRWITASANVPGLDAARDRFIAAATSCASLEAIEDGACPFECTMSGGTCGAGDAGPCSTELPYSSSAGQCDVDGNYLSSPLVGRMFTVACGGGTECVANVGCALPGANACAAVTTGCAGESFVECDGFQRVTSEDCSLEGATCDASSARCVPTSSDGACAWTGPERARCASDTHLLQCSYGQIRYLPCSDLGLSQCTVVTGGAVCH